MAFETLRYEVASGGVATVTLDQPETRNALSDQVLDELIAAFEAARDDEAVRCVVLTSSHEKVFSSGANLGGFAEEQPLVHKHLGTDALPAPVPPDRRARQAQHLRRQRARARRARSGSRSRAI